MSDLTDILSRLNASGGLAQRCSAVLEWVLSTLDVEGIALFTLSGPGGTLETRMALGTMVPTAPLLAAELSRMGIPATQTILPVAGETADTFLCCPVSSGQGKAWSSALVLLGKDVQQSADSRREALSGALASLREVLDEELGPGLAPGGRESAVRGLGDLLPNPLVLLEGLRLPLYACSLQGAFTFASPGFLRLTGYDSLEALQASRDFFLQSEQRSSELSSLRRQGKVESFPLVVKSGSGGRLEIRDSAISLGDTIFGMFFDVTGLVAANAELKDALQVQELLNDSILAGANQLQRTQSASIRALARLAEYRDPEPASTSRESASSRG